MKLLKTAILGGMVLTTSAIIVGGTFAVLTNKNKIVNKLKICNSKKIKVLQ